MTDKEFKERFLIRAALTCDEITKEIEIRYPKKSWKECNEMAIKLYIGIMQNVTSKK